MHIPSVYLVALVRLQNKTPHVTLVGFWQEVAAHPQPSEGLNGFEVGLV